MTLPYEPDRADFQPWASEETSSELVRRLRELRWPEVSTEVRQRCWEELSRQVTELGGSQASRAVEGDDETTQRPCGGWHRGSDASGERRFGRHDFAGSTGLGIQRGALAHRVAVARRAAVPLTR